YSELYAGAAWVLPFRAFLVRSESGVVLIDAGLGPKPGDFLPARQGWLPSELEAAGVSPDAVEIVLLTHLHVDHIGWAAADGRPYFSRARYVASASDWVFFEAREESRVVFEEKLAPLERAGVLELIEPNETEIAPGIVMLPSPGHTPGHMSVRVAGGEAEAVILGDVRCRGEDTLVLARGAGIRRGGCRRGASPERVWARLARRKRLRMEEIVRTERRRSTMPGRLRPDQDECVQDA
ncbi:MAG: MBL fold metallo-hydrolase, partial [Actinobacteria bacterium]